jgi:hypothetical protein
VTASVLAKTTKIVAQDLTRHLAISRNFCAGLYQQTFKKQLNALSLKIVRLTVHIGISRPR